MRISGLGLVPATYDEKTQTVSYQVTQKLRDKSCTVIISAKSGPKKVEASWSFSIDDGGAPATGSQPRERCATCCDRVTCSVRREEVASATAPRT